MRLPLLTLALLILSCSVVAQSPTAHTHENPDTIDGSKTPELIPDSTAWRLWLLSLTQPDPKHPELEQRRQDAYLKNAGFEDADLPALRQALYDFRVAYDSMIADHNLAVDAGLNPSLVSLKTRRDALVKSTQASFLSVKAETAERVKQFVNGEKARMMVSKTEVQQ